MNLEHSNKYNKLALGLLFDAVGYLSFIIPGFGELTDFIWAPISAWLMTKMYSGKKGKVGAVVSFVEELLPGFDIIPSFTLMWLYTFVLSSSKESSSEIE
ncbi:hypothetical protein ES676_05335 [Bizionia saleffrena]|uniref:Uncharacterized protein n=1 Tax=Bizionia saleffrena TaxID=291189 RepID=A0A8H2QF24_9FLAO|nr:hypothetical protein [Bizionia saleffrena]TYB76765.1 hypothetical protein ES676_05335 [Bizionia saleffrena]